MAKAPRFQGAGSSVINPTKLSNAFDELQKLGVDISCLLYTSVPFCRLKKMLFRFTAEMTAHLCCTEKSVRTKPDTLLSLINI